MANNEATITIYGRLSYPIWGHAEAVARNAKGNYVLPADQVTPEFNLLVEQAQFDRFKNHVLNVFLPYCVAQEKAGEKRNALSQADADRLIKLIESEDWDAQPPYIPIKAVPEKTVELAPECLAMIKVKGQRSQDLEQRAIISSETEMLNPDPDLIVDEKNKKILPIGQTVHQMYPGCYVTATLNLYAFISGKLPGFSASTSIAVFKADGDRFGGGVQMDSEQMFMD